jgi:hypothetical protein
MHRPFDLPGSDGMAGAFVTVPARLMCCRKACHIQDAAVSEICHMYFSVHSLEHGARGACACDKGKQVSRPDYNGLFPLSAVEQCCQGKPKMRADSQNRHKQGITSVMVSPVWRRWARGRGSEGCGCRACIVLVGAVPAARGAAVWSAGVCRDRG